MTNIQKKQLVQRNPEIPRLFFTTQFACDFIQISCYTPLTTLFFIGEGGSQMTNPREVETAKIIHLYLRKGTITQLISFNVIKIQDGEGESPQESTKSPRKYPVGEFPCVECDYVAKRKDKLNQHFQTQHLGVK